ncbi:MAG: hypothetical protein A4E72_00864 [Syntrophus sp. PtaU1.Bin208]|nr:MAG: hypothetical protein A4E72_00864 [Syntrophus sp. PtaU1.Bin208]
MRKSFQHTGMLNIRQKSSGALCNGLPQKIMAVKTLPFQGDVKITLNELPRIGGHAPNEKIGFPLQKFSPCRLDKLISQKFRH